MYEIICRTGRKGPLSRARRWTVSNARTKKAARAKAALTRAEGRYDSCRVSKLRGRSGIRRRRKTQRRARR